MDIVTIQQIIQALENPELTKGGLATAMGVGNSSVTSLLKGERKLSAEEMPRVVEYLRLDRVPLVGRIGAGGDIDPFYEQPPMDGWDMKRMPFLVDPDMIALEVDGDSMPDRYDEGDILVVYKTQKLPLEAFYGEEAAVLTETGRRLLKRIEPGSKKNTVDLHSYDGRRPIIAVKLNWIGEIYQTLGRNQLARFYQRQQGRRRLPRLAARPTQKSGS